MTLHRIKAKAFVENPSGIELSDLIPVFHNWIRRDALDELLIDVANYAHVQDGPGIMLIAHEADYALDLSRGRPGLSYTRKRSVPEGVEAAVELALRQLFTAASLLEAEPSLDGTFAFRTDEIELAFLDRLQLPNEQASVDLVRDGVEHVLKQLYDTDDVSVEWAGYDSRLPFAIRASIGEPRTAKELAGRLALTR